jgi:hypothetical protein
LRDGLIDCLQFENSFRSSEQLANKHEEMIDALTEPRDELTYSAVRAVSDMCVFVRQI